MPTDDPARRDPESPPGAGGDRPHRDDGLELARTLSRAAAGWAPRLRRRGRPADRPGSGTGEDAREQPDPGPSGRGQLSGSHPDDRDPQLLGSVVSRLVQARGWELDLRVRGVFARWEQLVGSEVAGHCRPESFADGQLVVRADSTAWATQLRLLAPALVRRLNEELGAGTVTAVTVEGPQLPSWRKGRRSVRDGRGPRDTYG